ncbi:MAG: tetratricopeptide repeat protein [Elusimicrobia bacterium]|nr:tetratricopeptide repeat protein [Elusimicrobiota bacterium]
MKSSRPNLLFAALPISLTFLGCAEMLSRRLIRQETMPPEEGAYVSSLAVLRPPSASPAGALTALFVHWGLDAAQGEIRRQVVSPGLGGTIGYDLARYAQSRGLFAMEAYFLDTAVLDVLLEQNIPVLVRFGSGGLDHCALVLAHDRKQGLWIVLSEDRSGGPIRDKLFRRAWDRAGRWAFFVFPPEMQVTGLGAARHLRIAELLKGTGRPSAALRHMEEALRSRSQDLRLWLLVGQERLLLGRPGPAEAAYRQAVRLDPSHPEAYRRLSELLMKNPSRRPEAEFLAREAVALCLLQERRSLDLCYALETLGKVLQEQGRVQESRSAFRAALASIPPDAPLAKAIRKHIP